MPSSRSNMQPAKSSTPNTAKSPAPSHRPGKTDEPARAQADQQLKQLLSTDLSKRKVW